MRKPSGEWFQRLTKLETQTVERWVMSLGNEDLRSLLQTATEESRRRGLSSLQPEYSGDGSELDRRISHLAAMQKQESEG